MKRLLFTLAGIFTFAALSAECSVIEVPLVQRVNASSLIVEGKVTEQYSYWNSNHTMIYTANKIELYKIFKGSVFTTAIEIITEGGTVDMDRIIVEPTLVLHIGDEGIFTCTGLTRVQNNITSRNALPQFEAYASLQGFVKYAVNANTASDPFRSYSDIQTEVYNVCAPAGNNQYTEVSPRPVSSQRQNAQFMAGPDPQSFAPTSLNAGVGDVLEIFGEGFGAVRGTGNVLFPNGDDGGATFITPLATQYLVWQDDYIKVEVPSEAGTGTIEVMDASANSNAAPGILTINYSHLNVQFDPGGGTEAFETDHINDNGSGGYTWRMNTGFDGNAPARASFMRAFDSWRCGTLVNWSIGTTTSINDAVSDGTNIICFDNASPLSPGILGVCFSYWSGCASGPTIIWYVNELDIIFDEGSNITPLTWEFGPAAPTFSEYDFETVAVHELGHGHQLGHVIQPGAIMHYAISNGSSNRTLGVNDVAGGQYVQSKSIVGNICGPGAMSNTSCGSPPVAAFNAVETTVCVGESVLFQDLSTGAPTQWLWTFTGASPSSSTLQNPTVFYAAPGVYDVTLTATNANGSDGETILAYITVAPNPTVGFSSNPGVLTVCENTMVTLSGTGAVSYNWSGGITNGVPFSATASDVYTVFGTDANGCIGINNATVTVNSAPSISVTSNPANGIVCSGGQATLSGNGAVSYVWTGGITDGVAFTPPATTTYTVTGTDGNGCTGTSQSTITVQACSGPVAAFSAVETTVCVGESVLFQDLSTGAPTSWLWTFTGASPSSSTLQNPTVFYSTPGVYDVSLTVTNGNGSDGETILAYITVAPNPTVGFTSNPGVLTVCENTMVTLSGTGAVSYNWSGGVTNGVPFAATASDVYTVFGTDANGCIGINNATVTVNAAPTISVSRNPSNGIVCTGNQATLTASGAQSYSWTGGVTNGVPFVPPVSNSYTVTATAANGCTATATTSLTVQACSFITQLNSTWCGASNCNLTQTIVANQVSGATNYEFWFENVSLGYSQTRVKGNGIANLPLSWISGVQYGATYQVRVRAFVGGVWQSYGPTCNLTMAAQTPPPQLTNCATTGLTLSSYLVVNSVAGASDYEYEVTNAQQPLTVTRLRGSSTPSIAVSWFPGIQYGRTYNVRVRARVGSVWSSYGPTCTFAMQATNPPTQLTNCAATGLTRTSTLVYGAVTGATNYQINISNAALGYNVTKLRGNNSTSIGLGLWTGLQANTTYTVTISSFVGGVWGPFGPPCTITIGAVFRTSDPNAEAEEISGDFGFGISMYPNPLMNGTNPTLVISNADQKDAYVNVLDLTGRVVASYKVFVEGDNYTTELHEFPDLVGGMYIMQVQVGDQVQSQKFIAE